MELNLQSNMIKNRRKFPNSMNRSIAAKESYI